MNEAHFETIDRNKDINLQRNKIKFLEDRIATLERTLESHAKILARFQMTEGDSNDTLCGLLVSQWNAKLY